MFARLFFALCFAYLGVGPLAAQTYKPGDSIEYKVGGSFPEKWERGVVLKVLDGGKQYLIREKPSQFFPEGPEKAYAPTNLRMPGMAKVEPKGTPPKDTPVPPKAPDIPLPMGTGLLSKADVVAYTKQVFGHGDPFADGVKRDANHQKIRDFIKARGTNFLPDDTFKQKELPPGTYAVHLGAAIEDNYGKPPDLKDYYGTYLLRTTNRGTKTTTGGGSKITITTVDAQFESGALIIKPDHTFLWKLGRNDPETQWIKGQWREATADEKQPWEGGPSLWLLKARQGEDYSVRMCRVPGYEGWIDVGMGKGRIAASYGRRP